MAIFESRTKRELELELAPADEVFRPKTALVLCLRGTDPSLPNCLKSIEQQSFDNFELHVVVDDLADPALEVLKEFQATSRLAIHTHLITDRRESCSLKCSAIITAIENAGIEYEVFAFIDADAIVTSEWLMELIAPLAHPEVGASTGNRWFRIPPNQKLGSAVRGGWNAAAVVQMYLYEIPWGGSLALRREVIDKAGLVEKWSKCFCEDTMLTRILHREGYQIARPVELIVVNDESTTLRGAFRWIQRQLLTVRLHHPRWALIWLHGLATGLPGFGVLLALACLWFGATYAAGLTLTALLLFELAAMFTMMAIVDAHQPLLHKSDQFEPFGKEVTWYLLTLPVTQTVHFLATIAVTFARRISWRKIVYSLGRKSVRMTNYLPYANDVSDETNSIE